MYQGRNKNMEDGLMRTCLVFGIILLFVGTGIVSGISGDNEKIINYQYRKYCNKIESQQTSFVYPPEEEWNRTYGGAYEDNGYSVQQTSDGGYIIAGVKDKWIDYNTWSFYGDGWLIKTDMNGSIQWDRNFGTGGQDILYSVDSTSDGGYILSGVKCIAYEYCEGLWLIKTDGNGNVQWSKIFQSGGDDLCIGFSVQQTSDGGYIVTGVSDVATVKSSDGGSLWLIKTNSNGIEQWNKTFYKYESAEGRSVQQTSDGGYIITGLVDGIKLIKTDELGNEQWNRTFGEQYSDIGYSVQQTTDGGYIIAGSELIKTDINGIEQWSRTISGCSIQQTADGSYIIVGEHRLIKTDINGIEEWNRTFGSTYWGNSVQQTTDKGYIITGTASSDLWLIKIANKNHPPEISVIDGPSWGLINIYYTFCIRVTDPDGDNLYCKWDWGDGNESGWLGLYASGVTICTSHAWSKRGTYNIQVKLKDDNGLESNCSDPHIFNVYELKKVYIFGRYTNLTEEGGYITIEAVNLRLIFFNLFQWIHYINGEKVTFVKDTAKVIIFPRFIIGFVYVVT